MNILIIAAWPPPSSLSLSNHFIFSTSLSLSLPRSPSFVRLSVRSSVRPSVRPSVCPFFLPYVCPSVRLSFFPSARPSVRSFVRSSVHPFGRSVGRSSARPSFLPPPFLLLCSLKDRPNCIKVERRSGGSSARGTKHTHPSLPSFLP